MIVLIYRYTGVLEIFNYDIRFINCHTREMVLVISKNILNVQQNNTNYPY